MALEREEAASRKFDSLSCIVVCRWLWSHVGADGFDRGLGAIVLLKWPSRHSGNKSLGPCHDGPNNLLCARPPCFIAKEPVAAQESRHGTAICESAQCKEERVGVPPFYGDWPKWWNSSKGARVNVKLLFYQAANAVWTKEYWSR